MSDTSVLENFGRNLTELAENDELDPIVGRDKEIERISQILSRRKKNNPVLIGEPGVGKTAIVEGLAKRIVNRDVLPSLKEVEIIELSMGSLVAGTRFRGQFEERIKAVVDELEQSENKIIFIDELHTVMGAGQTRGGLDASNMLKPALARGKFQCIGATTLDEYRKGIEGDGALERRFQKVLVEPSSQEETIEILKEIRPYYEDHHNVRFDDEVIERAVKLSDRYITDRYLPDKAFDVIDEAGSRVHLTSIETPEDIIQMEDKIDELEEEKQRVVEEQEFEKAAEVRDEIKVLEDKVEERKLEWMEKTEEEYYQVTEGDISEVVSMITGIPIENVSASEREKILNLEDKIQESIVGQDQAVEVISKAMKRARSGIKDPQRPIGTFLFLGPTGVGKTETAKVLCEEMFESRDNLIRVDMSEYMEKFESTKLIGSPPGYVGHEEGGNLTEKVRRNPYSVVLLDEIEKAHPDIYNTLLQIMDDGVVTDGMGREVDFRNVVLIMTSNIGSEKLINKGDQIGFSSGSRNGQEKLSYKEIKSKVEDELDDTFAPEFLNRLDEVVVFNALDKEHIEQIIDLELEKLRERLDVKKITLDITSGAKDVIVEEGYNPEYGARPLQRKLRKLVEDPLSEMIINGEVGEGDLVKVMKKRGKNEVRFEVQ